jgi:hypothetical protein
MKRTVQPDGMSIIVNSKIQSDDNRAIISNHLTQILLLLGKLENETTNSNLPHIADLLISLLKELKELEANDTHFPVILRENLLIREKYTRVFSIPSSIRRSPDIDGIYQAVSKTLNSSLKKYLEEEKKMLASVINSDLSRVEKAEIIGYSLANAGCLLDFCSDENKVVIGKMRSWCEFELSALH